MTITKAQVSGARARRRSAHTAALSRHSCKETLTRRCASRPGCTHTSRTWAPTTRTAHAAKKLSCDPRGYAFKRAGRGPLPGAKQLRRLTASKDPSPACRALELQLLKPLEPPWIRQPLRCATAGQLLLQAMPRGMPRRTATSGAKESVQQRRLLRQLLRGSQPRGSVHQRWPPRQPPRGSQPRGSRQPSATHGWPCRQSTAKSSARRLAS